MHNVMKRGLYKEMTQTIRLVTIVLAVITLYIFTLQNAENYSCITIYLTTVLHLTLGYTRVLWKHIIM